MKIKILDVSNSTVIKTLDISLYIDSEERNQILLPRIGEAIELPMFHESSLQKYAGMNARIVDIHYTTTVYSWENWFQTSADSEILIYCTFEERKTKDNNEIDKAKYE